MADSSLIEQLKRAAELQRLRTELAYARKMDGIDWRYGSIARMIEADLARLVHRA